MITREEIVLLAGAILLSLVTIAVIWGEPKPSPPPVVQTSAQTMLLTDPFLQAPTEAAVQVVWFTEFAGTDHTVVYGQAGQPNLNRGRTKTVQAKTIRLSRMREDSASKVGGQTDENPIYLGPQPRSIWRHEAKVTDLKPNQQFPYQVISVREDGAVSSSDVFFLAAKPTVQTPLKILLTSDHQLMPMVPANLQKMAETVGPVDAVFLAGDLVNIPDRASEWFDDDRGNAFFPSLQGRASYDIGPEGQQVTYVGSPIIQNAPLFPAVGNHEVMGRFSLGDDLKYQFNHPMPHAVAAKQHDQYVAMVNPQGNKQVQQQWIKNQSFNLDTFRELFTLPSQSTHGFDSPDGEPYYAVSFGDIRLVSLYVTQIWRTPDLKGRRTGRYLEEEETLMSPDQWGYGQHIFESIERGSPQFNWLEQELTSPEFLQAKYKIVMFHHPPHTLGDNIVPAFTDPVQVMDRDESEQIQNIRYEYPKQDDYIIRDLVPLLEQHGVQLVFYGHSHLWNRFTSDNSMHFLESSNVGNTYGAATADNPRVVPEDYAEEYVEIGDPNGLEPVVPTISPLKDEAGQALPYIASNDITVFSILETETGTISSYYFDTRQPDSEVVKFDEFRLGRRD